MQRSASIPWVETMLVGFLAVGLLTATPAAAGGVSPGDPERFAGVRDGCPTFTWEASPGADAFELVAFALPPGLEPADVMDHHLTAENAVLYATVPGGATAWTPSAERCLAPGGRYAWFVRAVTAGEPSAWSEGRYFAVPAVPTAEELARAVDLIRQWEAANGGASLPLSPAAAAAAVPAAAPVAVAAAAADSGVAKGSAHPKSVPTAPAAVRGASGVTAGEAYGVVGTSASLTGAGLGAANTAGGPDLVLDGSASGEVNTLISEWGVDRPAPDSETFVIRNSGGGTIVLDVEGTLEANALDCPGCVGSSVLADSAVTSAKIAPAAVTNAKIAAGAVGSSSIHGNAVSSTHIVDGAVTSADIQDGTITRFDLAASSVNSGAIVDGAITGSDLAPSSVTTGTIADGTITGSDLAPSSVTTGAIADGTITNEDVNLTSSIYVSKSQLYLRSESHLLVTTRATRQVACDDANDLPIAGWCMVGDWDPVIAKGQFASFWTNPSQPALWSCIYEKSSDNSYEVASTIYCISVP